MTWYVKEVGKAHATAKKVAEYFDKLIVAGPEARVTDAVKEAITVSLYGMPENAVVKVEASGSQSEIRDATNANVVTGHMNSISLLIEPIWNFNE